MQVPARHWIGVTQLGSSLAVPGVSRVHREPGGLGCGALQQARRWKFGGGAKSFLTAKRLREAQILGEARGEAEPPPMKAEP